MQPKAECSREADVNHDLNAKEEKSFPPHDLLDPVYVPVDHGEDWDDDDEQDEGWGCDL